MNQSEYEQETFVKLVNDKPELGCVIQGLALKTITLSNIFKKIISQIQLNYSSKKKYQDCKLYQLYYIEIIIFSIEHGISVDLKNDEGFTALYVAAESGNINLVKSLLKKGADVNSQNGKPCQTPIFIAANNNHIEVAKLLISQGAIIDFKNESNQWPPLYIASAFGHTQMVKLLLGTVNKGSQERQ